MRACKRRTRCHTLAYNELTPLTWHRFIGHVIIQQVKMFHIIAANTDPPSSQRVASRGVSAIAWAPARYAVFSGFVLSLHFSVWKA